ncbi:MAG: hypothetical protein Kow0080_34160 [Candidatus Promineifilaceae bacterium]
MDITVDFLNKRLAGKLPTELPLGLVFVVGSVSQIWPDVVGDNGRFPIHQFELIEGDYRLRCVIPPEKVGHIEVAVGDKVRAGGHLTFDKWRAAYVLLARDVERVADDLQKVVAEVPDVEQKKFKEALKQVKKRADVVTVKPTEEMPPWVEKLKHAEMDSKPKVRKETAVSHLPTIEPVPDLPVPGRDNISPEMVEAFSKAVDSDKEIELPPEIMAKAKPEESGLDAPIDPVQTAVQQMPELRALKSSYKPDPPRKDPDWVVTAVFVLFLMIVVAAVLGGIYLYFQ